MAQLQQDFATIHSMFKSFPTTSVASLACLIQTYLKGSFQHVSAMLNLHIALHQRYLCTYVCICVSVLSWSVPICLNHLDNVRVYFRGVRWHHAPRTEWFAMLFCRCPLHAAEHLAENPGIFPSPPVASNMARGEIIKVNR